jgi:hypothetical protein
MFGIFCNEYNEEYSQLENKKLKSLFKKEINNQISLLINGIKDNNINIENCNNTFKDWFNYNKNNIYPSDTGKNGIEEYLKDNPKLINNIKRIFGEGDYLKESNNMIDESSSNNKKVKWKMKKEPDKKILLIWGVWSITKQMKGCIPIPCIGLKRLVNEDIKIMDLNEFRTSCLDSKTLKKIIMLK